MAGDKLGAQIFGTSEVLTGQKNISILRNYPRFEGVEVLTYKDKIMALNAVSRSVSYCRSPPKINKDNCQFMCH